jgi:DNA polymerase-3 subunit epsilon/ATP-dependent DNA helicase DinG
LTGAARAQPAWSDVEIAWDNQNGRLLRLLRALGELTEALESVVDHDEAWEELSAELAVQVAFWQTWRDRLWSVLAEPSAETIAWLTAAAPTGAAPSSSSGPSTGSGRAEVGGRVYLNAAPLSVGQHLREGLFANKDCVVLTSATLAAAGSFRYIRERLGLEEARELLLGSPFEYPRAALAYLPTDVPEPTTSSYQPAVEALLGNLIVSLEGRTLVLFTSYSQLRASYRALYEPLGAQGIALLAQGVDGSSRAHLLEGFKKGSRVALFGTASFWEGVDVIGEALSCLVIARLPFTSPGDPIFQARSEMFEEPFNQYAVPQAVLRFRQGFGRLIRSRSDRGVLVVLDRRLKTRYYGRAFLQSLPDCTFREGPAAQAASAAREWLSMTPDARVGAAVADAALSSGG